MNRVTRKQAVEWIMNQVKDELVVVSTGYLSRDVFSIKDRIENFYMCGSMGNAYPIGLGIALHSKKKVIVISGDGAALMSLGSLVVGNQLKLKNLQHYIIDNQQYGSTGGQPTCSDAIDFEQFHHTKVIRVEEKEPPSARITLDPKWILKRFREAVISSKNHDTFK